MGTSMSGDRGDSLDISDQVAAGGEVAPGGAVGRDASTPSPPVGESQANQSEDGSRETAAPTNLGEGDAAIPGFWQVASSDDEGLGDEDEGEWEDADDDDGEDDEEDDEEDDSGIVPPLVRDPLRGCQHYSRGCKLVAPCCGEVHWCRFCHNAKWEDAPDADKRHILDRHAVKEVVCYKCELKQPVSIACIGEGCGNKFGQYFCSVCNFLNDDLSKRPFHCNGCGICRVGGRDKFFHCDTCGCCYSVELRNNHKCIQDSMKQNCPICQENLFNSVLECRVLRCGHTMHKDCYNTLMEQARWPTCPLCNVSIMDSAITWHRLDMEIALTPMPEEYRDQKVTVLCNDCHATGEIPLHFLGLKCCNDQCGSYNTRRC